MGHGGFASLSGIDTTTRVVCQNTLGVAESELSVRGFRFAHKGDMRAKMDQARAIIGVSLRKAEKFEREAKAMAAMQLTSADAKSFFETAFGKMFGGVPQEKEMAGRWLAKRDEAIKRWLDLFEDVKQTQFGAGGTLWAGLNAVTEWVDHERGRMNEGRRFESTIFGTYANDKVKIAAAARNLLVVGA
jgi:hypothetical protein